MKNRAKRNTAQKHAADAQWGLRRARKNGLRIVEPKPNELQIDLDGSAELAIFRQQLSILQAQGIGKKWDLLVTESKRPGKFHATVYTQFPVGSELVSGEIAFCDIMRVLYQAVLGSDIRREAFNLCRVLNGNKYPIVFFEKGK